MPNCFIIQPFDGHDYDARYKEIYRSAIEAAGFTPYRVDEDPSASIPIEQIEKGIKEADVCFAEISEDNPNVWFELGLSIAHARDVCIVCSTQRTKFPFDVQHRQIIRYSQGKPSDFKNLGVKITERLNAIREKQERVATLSPPVREIKPSRDNLAEYETLMLALLASNTVGDTEIQTLSEVRREMERYGFTNLAANAGARKLARRALVDISTRTDDYNNDYSVIGITSLGWEWMEENLSQFKLRTPPDEIPF